MARPLVSYLIFSAYFLWNLKKVVKVPIPQRASVHGWVLHVWAIVIVHQFVSHVGPVLKEYPLLYFPGRVFWHSVSPSLARLTSSHGPPFSHLNRLCAFVMEQYLTSKPILLSDQIHSWRGTILWRGKIKPEKELFDTWKWRGWSLVELNHFESRYSLLNSIYGVDMSGFEKRKWRQSSMQKLASGIILFMLSLASFGKTAAKPTQQSVKEN